MKTIPICLKQKFYTTFLYNFYQVFRETKNYRRWQRQNRIGPTPQKAKQILLLEYSQKMKPKVFIETGTCYGDTTFVLRNAYKEIHTIELSQALYTIAKRRLARYKQIHILQGDSGRLLPELLKSINQSCLFWLDSHYSGGVTAQGDLITPILLELNAISSHPLIEKHGIFIDDARCFTGKNGYPTINEIREWAEKSGFGTFEIKEDIIRIYNVSAE